jgi:glucose-6-phosphate dehydrogenase assembly protein OpcA
MSPVAGNGFDLGVAAGSVAEIERELLRMRRAADGRAPETPRAVARASVLNLVVYAPRRAHAERATKTLGALAARHPLRAIVLYHDESGARELEADVSLHCHLPRAAGPQVCFEQIVVQTRRAAGHRLRSIVVPLLIPDLPVFLWWTGTPTTGERRFEDLRALAHRLIVDSAEVARPAVALHALSDLVARTDSAFGITDFNWTRLTAWRELIAQFFDVTDWRGFLDSISGVRIGFAVDMDGREIHPSQALLLLGWLAGRLGWRMAEPLAPSEAGGLLFRLARDGGASIQVRLRPRFLRGLDEGHVTGVRISADAGGRRAEFVAKRAEDGSPYAVTEVVIDERTVMRRTVLLPMPSVIDLLAEELTITGSDAVYERALRALCDLA